MKNKKITCSVCKSPNGELRYDPVEFSWTGKKVDLEICEPCFDFMEEST